jgi:hypothetical protein
MSEAASEDREGDEKAVGKGQLLLSYWEALRVPPPASLRALSVTLCPSLLHAGGIRTSRANLLLMSTRCPQ